MVCFTNHGTVWFIYRGVTTVVPVQECLEELLFGGAESLAASLGGRLQDAAVLLAGAPVDVMSGVSSRLIAQGIGRELVLVCDYM